MIIRTPDSRLRVFISSTLQELAEERKAARQAVLELRLAPVMFESGARPHPAQDLYRSYLSQSQVFIGIYWQSYGWVGPEMAISGLEDEYNLSAMMPRLLYIKNPAPNRDPALKEFLDRIRVDNASCYTYFSNPLELKDLVQNDLALMLTERFEANDSNDYPPDESKRPLRTNIPVPRNPLINRKQELDTVRNMLLQENMALITLTGTAGVGKSRLGLQIGKEMLEHFRDGVYLVRLESISDANLMILTIGEIFGIRETFNSRPVDEMLIDFLRDKQMLLLLDNFEQIVEAAPLVSRLLESCQQLKCIVTSRVPLRLRAEKVIPVSPLEVPLPDSSTEPNNLSQFAAVELFTQRAQAVKPTFSLTNANASVVAEICFRLDGLPLAIELAAARVKLLAPQELLSRLENRFDLLRNGPRDLPERQQTLREAIDWSYNLLDEDEKKLFRRLSIFNGGWPFEAPNSVCMVEGDISSNLDDTLISLIDNNLVVTGQETEEGARFGMLSTIHVYAQERLEESGEAELIRIQHAQYYLDFIRTVEPRIRSAERVHWCLVLQQETGNIREILEWITTSGNCLEIGQQIVINLGMLWMTSGYIVEGRSWCTKILSLSDSSTPVAIRVALLEVSGLLAWSQGDYSSAQSNSDESLDLLSKNNTENIDYKRLLAQAFLGRGMLASASRDLETASTMYQRCIELFRGINDQWFEAIALSWLGDIALYANDREQAKSLHSQSIKLARAQGDPWCLVPPLMTSAQVTLLDKDLVKARSLLLEAIDLVKQTGDQWSLTFALNDMGFVNLMEDELVQAATYFLDGLTLANRLGNLRVLLIAQAGIAALIVKKSMAQAGAQQSPSDFALAARLCGATVPHVDKPGIFIWSDSKMLYEESVGLVKSMLDEELWNKNYSDGQGLPLDQAIAISIRSLKEIVNP